MAAVLRFRTDTDAGITDIIQSWDFASKTGLENDWSVCTTWLRHDGRFTFLILFVPNLTIRACAPRRFGLHSGISLGAF